MPLSNVVRTNVLDAINGVASFSAPTAPMKVRLMTANGDATNAGTEQTTASGSGSGSGYTAGGQSVTFASAVNGTAAPTATLRWDNMPATTIVGIEVWDSAGTPKRWQYGALSSAKALSSGDSFELPVASFTETLI
jgi:hypothetical protein